MAKADLVVAGGLVVSGQGRCQANVAATDGTITYVGPDRPRGHAEVDARGLLVLPGAVDTHVHLMDPGSTEREDFPTGTAAAATAGVTTIIEHSHGQPVRSVDDLRSKLAYLDGRSNVDFGLAGHAWPGRSADVASLWGAGVSFLKVFTCTTHGVPAHDAAALLAHLQASADTGAMTLMHCEDESLTAAAELLLHDEGRTDNGVLIDWRNREAELVAVTVAALLVRRTGARATVAHVSSPEIAAAIQAERRNGATLAAEGCPQYFLLREDEVLEEGPLRKFTPPARARTDRDELTMWELLRTGALTHMSTDHAPSTLPQKRDGDIWEAHFGLPGLDSTMSVLLDAAARGQLAYEDVVRVYAEVPAKAYGLWPRKGRLAPGSDADIALVDPGAMRTLTNEQVISKAGWTPFDGREFTGRVLATYVRGTLVAEAGRPVDARAGMFLPGPGAQRH